jgi:hypothetical protein
LVGRSWLVGGSWLIGSPMCTPSSDKTPFCGRFESVSMDSSLANGRKMALTSKECSNCRKTKFLCSHQVKSKSFGLLLYASLVLSRILLQSTNQISLINRSQKPKSSLMVSDCAAVCTRIGMATRYNQSAGIHGSCDYAKCGCFCQKNGRFLPSPLAVKMHFVTWNKTV